MKVETYTRKLARLRSVANHIDAHLDKPLCLDELAEIAHLSPFHFERVFHAYAGETPMARVRRLRLAQARFKLERGEHGSLLDLALDSGYASAEAFSRAFRASHGIPPSAVRPKDPAQHQIHIETLPAQAIQYLSFTGELDESIRPFESLRAHALLAGIARNKRKGWCVHLSSPDEKQQRLLAALLSEPLGMLIPGLEQGLLPAGEYAVMRIEGSHSAALPSELASRIAAATGRQMGCGQILRCFLNSSYLPASFEKCFDLYVPLAPA